MLQEAVSKLYYHTYTTCYTRFVPCNAMGQRCSLSLLTANNSLFQETSNAQVQTDPGPDEALEQQVEALKIQLYNERNQCRTNEQQDNLKRNLEGEISALKRSNFELKESNEAFHDKVLEVDHHKKKHETWKKERNDALTAVPTDRDKVDEALVQQVEALKIQLFNERNQRQTDEQQDELRRNLECEISALKRSNSELKERNEAFHDKILDMESELADYEKKDEMWKKERNDVLLEIQRLKEEAERFIEILSSSHEDEVDLPFDKKQRLTAEVESLKLLVDLRTQEIHRLRDEKSCLLRKVASLEDVEVKFEKCAAKVEHLTAQLDVKRSELRDSAAVYHQMAAQLSKALDERNKFKRQFEELQWRLRNKAAFPSTQMFIRNGDDPSKGHHHHDDHEGHEEEVELRRPVELELNVRKNRLATFCTWSLNAWDLDL